jgi:hypothetical protein
MMGGWRRQTHRMAAPNVLNGGAKRIEWRRQTGRLAAQNVWIGKKIVKRLLNFFTTFRKALKIF